MVRQVEALLDKRVDVERPCAPRPVREWRSMFLTIESARLPCCTIFSRLPESSSINSAPSSGPAAGGEAMADFSSSTSSIESAAKLFTKFKRVLDFVRDAGGQLAKRGELFRLHQPFLCGAKFLQRSRKFARSGLHVLEKAGVLDRDDRLCREGLEEVDHAWRELAGILAPYDKRPHDPARSQQRND